MNKEVIQAIAHAVAQGQTTELVVIIRTSGSSPGKVGNAMLVSEDGLAAGTIGGGVLEFRSIQWAREALANPERRDWIRTHYLRPNEAEDLGAVCGGEDTLAFVRIPPSEALAQLFSQAMEMLSHNRSFGLKIDAGPEETQFELLTRTGYRDRLEYHEDETGFEINIPVVEKIRVVVYGAGHISQKLVPLIESVDFTCTVVDDSEQFANRERFPGKTQLAILPFTQAAEALGMNERDYAVIVTRGHSADYEAEKSLLSLRSRPAYIGCIGSKGKTRFVRERLMNDGFPEEVINRVYAPIGIDIHAKTPAEIAVSIVAQLIDFRYRHGEGHDQD